MEEELILETIVLVFLGTMSYFDIRYKKIPLAVIILFLFAGIVYIFAIGDELNILRYWGVLSGLMFCGFSFWSKQAIGFGDTLVFTVLGLYLGIYLNLLLLFGAFTLASLFFLFSITIKKLKSKASLPFIPFLYIVYGGICYL